METIKNKENWTDPLGSLPWVLGISGHGWNHETLGWCFSVSSSINKGIPDLFEAKTLKVFGVGGSEFVHLESA